MPGLGPWLPQSLRRARYVVDYTGAAPIVMDDSSRRGRGRQRLARSRLLRRARARVDATRTILPISRSRRMRSICSPDAWQHSLAARATARATPFAEPRGSWRRPVVVDCQGRSDRRFRPEHADEGADVFAAGPSCRALLGQGESCRRRLVGGLAGAPRPCARRISAPASSRPSPACPGLALGKGVAALAVIGLEQGFETPDLAVVGEQDILRGPARARPQEDPPRAGFPERGRRP